MQATTCAGIGILGRGSKSEINIQWFTQYEKGHVAPADGVISAINLRCYFEMFIN